MRFYLRISLFILYISNIIAQEPPPAVAVLDFEAKGIPVYEVETLTERLRSEIAKTKAIRLTDRKLLEKILQEQGLQQSGCTTDECAAEVGQLLGAQFMISGSIGKLGDTYTVDTKMVSVTTGATERAKTATYTGPVAGLIVEMEILAWEIVGLQAPESLLMKRSIGGQSDKSTVAVLDFEPRGISQLESQTLTDRFSTEINKTGKAVLVDRNVMNEVMQEQGYTAAECSSEECAAEVGALLGVQFMINGAIGKLGETYTIDAKMFRVGTGAAEKTINTTYTGQVDGLITVIELLAWEMMGVEPPQSLLDKRDRFGVDISSGPKQKTPLGALIRSTVMPGWGQFYSDNKLMGWSFLGGELALGALAYLSYSNYVSSHDDFDQFYGQYSSSSDPLDKQNYKTQAQSSHQELTDANDQMTLMLYGMGGLWIANMVHAYMTGPTDIASNKGKPKIDLVLNEFTKEPQLRLSWRLDK